MNLSIASPTIVAAAAFSVGAFVRAAGAGAPPGDAANGKRLYLADGCFTCHGRAGQGGAFNGPAPALAKTEMPFDGFKGSVCAIAATTCRPIPRRCCRTRTSQTSTPFCSRCRDARSAKDIAILND